MEDSNLSLFKNLLHEFYSDFEVSIYSNIAAYKVSIFLKQGKVSFLNLQV
jgi:hypothetical protein